jgi:hypothetical protein
MNRPRLASLEPSPADPLAGPRKAALLLHAMPAESRLWILGQLPPAQSEKLCDLLTELRELGIPADQALLHEILSSDSAPAAGAAPVSDVEAQLAVIENAGPGSVWLALRDEPAGLIARFLALFDWRWEQGFLEQLGPSKRHQVQKLLPRYRGAPSRVNGPDLLRAQLLARLSERLADFQVRWVLDQTLHSARGPKSRNWWQRSRSPDRAERPDR